MDILFLGIVIFLFILAVFDLSVGVSNDAVNFLSSAVGSRAASFKRIVIVAAIGVFIGAAMSNGMMDIARHGIFRPSNLSFYDVTAIFMAVMVTDIILLDIFNSLGMPTSTTVSMVFELLGAAFVVAMFKMAAPESDLAVGDLINAEKALSVIVGIFLSVAIAFIFGTVVQFLARVIFTFEYKSRLKWKIGIFGGIACTAFIYFMLIKGIKDLTIMTPDVKAWISSHSAIILCGCMLFFTMLMQLLHALRVNVLKVIVLLGTFSLAMAFAGNDLVNFIGVPLTSLYSYQDFMNSGGGDPHSFMMTSLNESASTPFYYLIGAGMIMVVSLATSKKARRVTQTTVGLSAQSQGDEMFGSSRLGRSLVRATINISSWISDHIPDSVKKWVAGRMDATMAQPEDGASFDLVRGSVNLMLAAMLIAFGTSLKLPLSTTFVTFMVAMGTSLADKAWGRESAVFRITGVISVIGGWFITAGVAFIGAGIVVSLMHLGGAPVMIAGGLIALTLLIRSNIRFRKAKKESQNDTLFQTILSTDDQSEIWPLFNIYVNEKERMFLQFAAEAYHDVTTGFLTDNVKILSKAEKALNTEKEVLKSQRRKLTLCLRRVAPKIAIEKNAWFHLSNNMALSITHCLIDINDVCKEHVDNNFRPIPPEFISECNSIQTRITDVLKESVSAVDDSNPEKIDLLRQRCETIKADLTKYTHRLYNHLQDGDADNMTVLYVYLNLLQESQELVTSLRKMLRAVGKLNLAPRMYRSFTQPS